ncbi:N-6 DNA methylase [Amycolatopsis sp. cmx-8-4]|uniref:N-6 DNA methylase n=1 Tax=Amycolatopsis sp. cmx-8-4 TaxID=2790947 RepID=UPI003979B41F
MGKVSTRSLLQEVWKMADLLRGNLDTSEYLKVISAMLVLKWASDNPGRLTVPIHASWRYITANIDETLGQSLNKALREISITNYRILGDSLELFDFSKGLNNSQLHALVAHMDGISLGDDVLESKDAVGDLYDGVMEKFAFESGKKGAEFRTPRSVVSLMVRLIQLKGNQSIYDPFAGSGGFLIQAQRYAKEMLGRGSRLALFGQELNSTTYAIARINLLLHGISDASLLQGDSLAEPMHRPEGTWMRFDRIITNPPFSTAYQINRMQYPDRMRYGWTSESGKKADWMNVQHVLSSLNSEGIGAVVSPHGVLFRGGAEAEIRRKVVLDGRISGIIGIGPNVFQGTGIPACILVLRGVSDQMRNEEPEILFINAEHEISTGRSQNYLEPRHMEKIVDSFLGGRVIPGFSRKVSLAEIAENDFNLNIRRYVDLEVRLQSDPDPRAIIQGGVPEGVVRKHEASFRNFGIDVLDLFESSYEGRYLRFPRAGFEATIRQIPTLSSPAEERFDDRSREWCDRTAWRLQDISENGSLLAARDEIKESLCEGLYDLRILDEVQLNGVFADWWEGNHENLKRIDRIGSDKEGGNSRDIRDALHLIGDDLHARLRRLVAASRQNLIDLYRSWGEQYAISLRDLEEQRRMGAQRIEDRLRRFGYSSLFAGQFSSDGWLP